MLQNQSLEIRLLSSLEKVFADEELKSTSWKKGSMLANEVYSFQVAYNGRDRLMKNVKVKVTSELSDYITIRKVELVPSEMPCYPDYDADVLRTTPGLYPDPLISLSAEGLVLLPNQWRSLWITVRPGNQMAAGVYPIEILFYTESVEELAKAVFQLEVLPAKLPKQTLIHTQWFHSDCIATWYDIAVFSEAYWHRVAQYLQTAVKHGINMILTPLFTPPLDTAVGGERPTVQLVDVKKSGETYTFCFDRLQRWIDLCLNSGVEFFEFSHLFTQWGAYHAPKIIAKVDGEEKKIFGWDTDAAGDDYKNFLNQFLPALVAFIKEHGLEARSYFHVSDEPSINHLDSYKSASSIIMKYLSDFPVIDALSDYKFYENGIVKNPIPATNHIKPFLENQVPDLWTYYCCGQYQEVANRFFNMPSTRNRILGIQLYKFDIKGFLQWGYDFWYAQYSRCAIDPFRVTDSGYAFPSGDAFVVYPGADGPIESLRFEVFFEALQDLRALKLLEELIGREAVINMLEEELDTPITFSEYPRSSEWILMKREQINKKIAELSK